MDGVWYQVIATDNQLVYDFTDLDSLYNATMTFELSVSQEILDTSTNVQPFAQMKSGDWPGHWDCWINSADLTLAAKEFECSITTDTLVGADESGFQVGFQVKNDATPSGTVTVHSFTITPASAE